MAHDKPRILVAGFQHETNTFVPKTTTFAEFEDGGGWPPLTTGAEVAEIFRPLNIPLGGMIAALEERAEVIAALWANAEPSGLVADTAFDRIAGMILDAVRKAAPLDGICLDLHGAMVTESHADGEAELLRRIRAETGPLLPLVISLDLHANISPDLVAHADAIAIYRTYPHLDMDETGARAAALLMRMIAQGTRPARAFRQADALIPLSAQCTDFGPLAGLYGSLSDPGAGIWSADIALG
ncbi:MAG: M81 family metallopeptidase, partial [Pseudomonadota bacterium]